MRKSCLFVFILLSGYMACSQTPAELEAVLKKVQRMQDSIKNDPKYKELMNKMGTPPAPAPHQAPSSSNLGMAKKKFPPRNTVALAALPRKTLSKTEVVAFASKLHADLVAKLPASKVAAAQAAIVKLKKDSQKIAVTGVAAWYNNAPSEAALLLTYAAAQSPDDNTLSNCGAVLSLCGLEQKAIPLLKFALANQPGNSTLLNNIGQAYAGLGARDSAMVYLMGCIRKCDTHPQACATAAYIENQNGNTDKAKKLAEQAIKGGYTDEIASFYKEIDKDALLGPLLQSNYSHKKFFQMNGFEVGVNCTNWDESETSYSKQEAAKKKLDELMQHFVQVAKENSNQSPAIADIQKWNSDKNWKNGPLYKVAFALRTERFGIYTEKKGEESLQLQRDFMKLGQEAEPEYRAVRDKYNEQYRKHVGPVPPDYYTPECLEIAALDNKYFEKKARLANKLKDKWMIEEMKVYDDMIFLDVLTAPNKELYQAECAAYAQWLISSYRAYTQVICLPSSKPECLQPDEEDDEDSDSPDFKTATCPLDVELPFVVGVVKINCERFEFEGGEGIILNFEKNFKSRESTLAIGLGVGVHIGAIPVINGRRLGAEASVKEQFYIKFDGNNQATDVGARWEAEVKGPTGEGKVGYSIGVVSGYTPQSSGAFSGLLN